jgi:hypothetical protein
MYQRRPPNLTTSTADLSERDIKENLVVKEEERQTTCYMYAIRYAVHAHVSEKMK